MTWSTDWEKCKNILCVRLDNMGDIIMMTPALRALRDSFPDATLSLLTSPQGGKITPYIPEIDNTIMYDAPWIENTMIQSSKKNLDTIVSILRIQQFDGAILFSNFSQSPFPAAIVLYLAHIPRILGYCRELPYPFITHWIPDTEPFTFPVHGVIRQLTLLSYIGVKPGNLGLSLSIHKDAQKRMRKNLRAKHINQPFIVVHPGVSLSRRQYPTEYFVTCAKEIISKLGYHIIITGNTAEQLMAKQMETAIGTGAVSLAGQTTIEELIAIIADATMVISNNTAPVHIASAVQTPVIDLYARSNPEHTPWQVKNRILYFDIPPTARTQNTTLLSLLPSRQSAMPQPHHIVQAVKELLLDTSQTKLPEEITKWEAMNVDYSHKQSVPGSKELASIR